VLCPEGQGSGALSRRAGHLAKNRISRRRNPRRNPREIDFDPYVIGLWLGDGTSKDAELTNRDSAILQYLSVNLQKFDCYLQHQNRSYNCYVYRINGIKSGYNPFFRVLRNHNMLNNKHIPDIYKYNSREIRMAVLAGFIDTDGSLPNGRFFASSAATGAGSGAMSRRAGQSASDLAKNRRGRSPSISRRRNPTCYEIFQAPNHKTLIDDMVMFILLQQTETK